MPEPPIDTSGANRMHSASRSQCTADQRILERLEECLSSSVIDLRASTNLVLADGLLLAHVLRAAEPCGESANLSLSDCIVACGSSRLLLLCRSLRQQTTPVSTHCTKLRAITDKHRKLVC